MSFNSSLKIGIIGGGQLGKMLIQAALDLDFEIFVLENDPNCPCSQIAHRFILGNINDFQTVYNFGQLVDIVTIEIENVNVEALLKLEKEGKKVFPQPNIIAKIKHKCTQKAFFKAHNIPTADFINVRNIKDIKNNLSFLPAVNKIGVGGYDGKGVQILRTEKDIEKAFDADGILEKLIDFDKELAVIVARNENGDIKAYPVVEMVFHPVANLVEYLFSPAHITSEQASIATQIAIKTAQAYQIVGLLAIELFLTKDNQILVNEVAPRPHNSGHHSQKANYVSQFDQHIRAITGLPLGNTDAICASAMVNLLGEANYDGPVFYEGIEKIMAVENIFPFFYGKKRTKPFRKMGHVSILESNFEKLKEKVNFVTENLKVISK
jgi:5-(carboxyamino)imidazole ribonucleotide synthase